MVRCESAMNFKRHPWHLRAGIGALVALVALLSLADFLPHTDDGCAVEQHCLACRTHVTTVSDLLTFAPLAFGADAVTFAAPSGESRAEDVPVARLPPGRAPPKNA